MKKTQILAIAALAAAVTFQTAAKAEDPVSPVQGAVCNLYLLNVDDLDYNAAKTFIEVAATLPRMPAAATFVDTAGDFKDAAKQNGIASDVGMWTGWLKQEKAGLYTFLCKRATRRDGTRYSIWINGEKCVESVCGQNSFNVELNAGFNFVKIITWDRYENEPYPLTLSYKRAGGLKEPESFGPGDMFHDDEE